MADWTRQEVEATVADALAMREAASRGLRVNKSEFRRRLLPLLNGRSEAAVEKKRQNISAVLIDLSLPPLDGYQPLFNYQQLLYDVVLNRVAKTPSLLDAIRAELSQAVVTPPVEDILRIQVDPPAAKRRVNYPDRVRERPTLLVGLDYLAMEASKRELGEAGEELATRFERARLLSLRRDDLAARVERVSVTRGDGLGYDISSFEHTGEERLIEVKTTRYNQFTPFYVSRNELAVSHRQLTRYHLYRVFDFRTKPRLFSKRGPLDHEFALEAESFKARIA